MLINLSNHPAAKWNAGQLEQAQAQYGEVRDLPFPKVDPYADEAAILQLAHDYVARAQALLPATGHHAVHLMGEMTLTYALVQAFRAEGLPCIASTTAREVAQEADGTKTSVFRFVRFREYK